MFIYDCEIPTKSDDAPLISRYNLASSLHLRSVHPDRSLQSSSQHWTDHMTLCYHIPSISQDYPVILLYEGLHQKIHEHPIDVQMNTYDHPRSHSGPMYSKILPISSMNNHGSSIIKYYDIPFKYLYIYIYYIFVYVYTCMYIDIYVHIHIGIPIHLLP